MLKIGAHVIDSPVLLAPMAGISDQPFRALCRRFGAGLTTTEMVTSDTQLWHSRKSGDRLRLDSPRASVDKPAPISVQIAGSDPVAMANAARRCVAHGAEIVDINMGCPAKKVCKRNAGSALLKDEALVASILSAVVAAVAVPVTLKTRTGSDCSQRNGPRIARLAEDCGVQALTVHGRTRACKFNGEAEFDTIAEIVQTVAIPVIANGDIDSPGKAAAVLAYTGAAAVMVGRAARGNPWLFGEIAQYLRDGTAAEPPSAEQQRALIAQHLAALHEFYGETKGLRIARKHFAWYCQQLGKPGDAVKAFNQLQTSHSQIDAIHALFEGRNHYEEQAA